MAQIERVFTRVKGRRYMACLVEGTLFYAPCETYGNYMGWCYEQMVSMPLVSRHEAMMLHPLCENAYLVGLLIETYLNMPSETDD